ncbi:MAG: GTPase HflX [Deltaproteobacteria bacterium]|nr:GTPase HflX [Deltaproteobacteria bacterium]
MATPKIQGNIQGLKKSQLKRLGNLWRRRTTPQKVVSSDTARAVCQLSAELRRQIGLLINRAGNPQQIVVGDAKGLLLPALPRQRGARQRLRGLRLVHTHLADEPLSEDDLADLALLRLDLVASLSVGPEGLPGRVRLAHLRPGTGQDGDGIELLEADHMSRLSFDCAAVIQALEEELARDQAGFRVADGQDRALLVSVSNRPRWALEESLAELSELSRSAGVEVLGRLIQQVKRVDPTFLLGRGKLSQVAIQALQTGANLLLFDQDLSPSQARNLARLTELRIIDRTQLILDIFAQRARSHEGKLQVEMAQLRHRLPHLADKDNALSRLTGGIGARGPGETKLEIDRRRVRDRIARLSRDLEKLKRQRAGRRKRRQRSKMPVISIVGYTNAGKSTLLNTLTQSRIGTENRLFATLDPTSRRLKLPRDQEVIITDTVGFIRRLPGELIEAFQATLEELTEADLLIHLVDAVSPGAEDRIEVVERLLDRLGLQSMPRLTVFNKTDLADPEKLASLVQRRQGLAVCALNKASLLPLVQKLEEYLARLSPARTELEEERPA